MAVHGGGGAFGRIVLSHFCTGGATAPLNLIAPDKTPISGGTHPYGAFMAAAAAAFEGATAIGSH